jgi:hypothetical protein
MEKTQDRRGTQGATRLKLRIRDWVSQVSTERGVLLITWPVKKLIKAWFVYGEDLLGCFLGAERGWRR